jgi:hypothetical protein
MVEVYKDWAGEHPVRYQTVTHKNSNGQTIQTVVKHYQRKDGQWEAVPDNKNTDRILHEMVRDGVA